ncbi:uncharacterized protein LOC124079280 [Marmota monax]|uniref:uncharacterized protein LOC124079280 n=1 Tax=Marmota monax TaxID=9995 RepID=UPI0026EC09D2|nr:uncharacterized protein LOC124079280 [Marmota monax]
MQQTQVPPALRWDQETFSDQAMLAKVQDGRSLGQRGPCLQSAWKTQRRTGGPVLGTTPTPPGASGEAGRGCPTPDPTEMEEGALPANRKQEQSGSVQKAGRSRRGEPGLAMVPTLLQRSAQSQIVKRGRAVRGEGRARVLKSKPGQGTEWAGTRPSHPSAPQSSAATFSSLALEKTASGFRPRNSSVQWAQPCSTEPALLLNDQQTLQTGTRSTPPGGRRSLVLPRILFPWLPLRRAERRDSHAVPSVPGECRAPLPPKHSALPGLGAPRSAGAPARGTLSSRPWRRAARLALEVSGSHPAPEHVMEATTSKVDLELVLPGPRPVHTHQHTVAPDFPAGQMKPGLLPRTPHFLVLTLLMTLTPQ